MAKPLQDSMEPKPQRLSGKDGLPRTNHVEVGMLVARKFEDEQKQDKKLKEVGFNWWLRASNGSDTIKPG